MWEIGAPTVNIIILLYQICVQVSITENVADSRKLTSSRSRYKLKIPTDWLNV